MSSAPATVATRVHPLAIEAMREMGIDISGHRSKAADKFAGQSFDYILTVCDSARTRFDFLLLYQKIMRLRSPSI
jgi:arsenate reductase (thioredoxin)